MSALMNMFTYFTYVAMFATRGICKDSFPVTNLDTTKNVRVCLCHTQVICFLKCVQIPFGIAQYIRETRE